MGESIILNKFGSYVMKLSPSLTPMPRPHKSEIGEKTDRKGSGIKTAATSPLSAA